MSVDKVSVQAVENIKNDGLAKRALSGVTEAPRAEETAIPVMDPALPPTTRQTIDKHSCTVVRCLHYIPAPY